MQFRNHSIVNKAFLGIGAAVPVMVLIAITSLSKSIKKQWINGIIIIVSVIAISIFNIHPVIVILASALYGIIFFRKAVE